MLYDRQGNEVGLKGWSIERGTSNSVANDHVDGMRVSTVFVGVDMGYGDGPPLIYETMVFPEDSWDEQYCDRYATEQDALVGHAKAIQWVKDGCKDGLE